MSDKSDRHLYAVPETPAEEQVIASGTAVFRYGDTILSPELFNLLMRREAAREYLANETRRINEEITSLTGHISDQAQEENIDPAIFDEEPK